ncbi:hypothetical protein [Bradyrhizobium macuxiense]|uniref:hypothetical protein n=1 Tax=Bradyrhizobium macuxiense TaxID=1755647 RepID=UPI00142EB1B0|nr:hypothetical protein [Bradyrhizobium macuxiense]
MRDVIRDRRNGASAQYEQCTEQKWAIALRPEYHRVPRNKSLKTSENLEAKNRLK